MEGIPNPERFTSGIDMINRGFNDTIEGTKMQLIGIFDDYMSPQKETYQNLLLAEKTSELATFKYTDTETGNQKTETFNGNLLEVVETGNKTTTKATQIYGKTPSGKLILSKANAYMTNPSGSIEMNISIDYQLVEDITFPSRFDVDSNQSVLTIETKGQWIVNFVGCKKI